MSNFHIRIAGDDLTFCASHFITLENGECERLHGHTYHVAAEAFGPLGDSRYVVDFVAARRALQEILAELDHRVLLPAKHPAIRLKIGPDEIEAVFADRRWVFPAGDCRPLPMANTTSELLAEYIGRRWKAALNWPGRIRIELDEGAGCTAVCEIGQE